MAWLLPLAALAMVVWLASLEPGRAGDVLVGPVWAQVVRVVDGDTIEVRARIAWCDGADGSGETEAELAKPLAAR